MTKRFFITSSGTEIGKTLVTAALGWQLRKKNYSVEFKKPILTGWGDEENSGIMDSDVSILLEAAELEFNEENADNIAKFKFAKPLSPNMAAEIEGQEIKLNDVISGCNSIKDVDFQLIEGIGGVMVPINNQYTVLDLIDKLEIPVLLVVGSYLGSISHTLTAIEAIQSRGLRLVRVFLVESEDSIDASLNEIKNTLNNFVAVQVTIIKRIQARDGTKIWQKLPDITGVVDDT